MSKMLKVVGASWLQTKISSYILGGLGLLAILALFVGQMERIQEDGTYAATVFYSKKTGYRIEYWGQSNELSDIPRGVARAYFRMDIETNGWSTLEVETDGVYPDEIQAYAAGIVEGALTWYLIHTHLDNTIRAKCKSHRIEKQCERLRDALDRSANTWKAYAAERELLDPFWHHVSLHYTQINGIFTGWKHGVERSQNEYETDISDLYWLNAFAEVPEIQQKLNISVQGNPFDALPGISTAFLRVVNETDDDGTSKKKLFLAHNAAGSYSSMMRILKRYKLNYRLTSEHGSPQCPGTTVDFSGYPGAVTSQDEFYVLRGNVHKMAISGTPLQNHNSKLWKNVHITDQVPVGPRVSAANHLATNVSTWGHVIASSNSGTGCKQWLVVDMSRFESLHKTSNYIAPSLPTTQKTAKKDLVTEISISGRNNDIKHTVVHRGEGRVKGLLWLIEQVPARTHSADLSDSLLDRGYWATYGVPHFKDIAEIIHSTEMEKLYGNIYTEADSPKAMMFKMGFKNATSLDSIIKLMRQNNMTAVNTSNETNSKCPNEDPDCFLNELSYFTVLGVRGDIISRNKEAYGVIDTKVVIGDSNSDDLEFIAISGPPFDEIPQENSTKTALNKGTIASIYTDQFDDEPNIDGMEIRDLVKQQIEEAEQEALEDRKKHIIQPFQWSESEFKNEIPKSLPDKWDFGPLKLQWAW